MNTNMTFSAIIPLSNQESGALYSLESIINQTYPAHEVIIIYHISKASEIEKIKNNNNAIKFISCNELSKAEIKNKGIREATGNYIAFLNPGDTWLPHYLQELENMAETFHDASILSTNYQLKTLNGQFIENKIKINKNLTKSTILKNNFSISSNGYLPFFISSAAIKRSEFHTIGDFQEDDNTGDDQDIFCLFAISGKIAYSPRVLSILNKKPKNHFQNIPEKDPPFIQRLTKLTEKENLDKSLRKQIIKFTTNHKFNIVKMNMESGRYHIARKLLSDKRLRKKPIDKMFFEILYATSIFKNKIIPKKRNYQKKTSFD